MPGTRPDTSRAARSMSAPEVIERYVSAIGGRAALGALRTVRVRARVTNMGLSGVNEMWRAVPGRTRETMVLGPHRLEEGSDGDSAWRIGLDGKPATLNGKELDASVQALTKLDSPRKGKRP